MSVVKVKASKSKPQQLQKLQVDTDRQLHKLIELLTDQENQR